jgi:chromosome segregation ATPase
MPKCFQKIFLKLQELSKQISQLKKEKEDLNGELGKKLAKVVKMGQEIEEKTKLLAEKANEIDALLSQLNEFRFFDYKKKLDISVLGNKDRRMGVLAACALYISQKMCG